jgi:hypothetical protein
MIILKQLQTLPIIGNKLLEMENTMKRLITDKKTSAEWQALTPEIIVLDPDGWNRKNYNYSWNVERITEKEYNSRVSKSTCSWRI